MDHKPLFRSQTQVLIPDSLYEGLKYALEALDSRRVLIFLDKNVRDQFPLADLCERFQGYQIRTEIIEVREPDIGWVDQQVDNVVGFKPDVVIGVGGGSLLDLAKAVSVLIENPGSAALYHGPNLIKRPGVRKIMIPTTAGTGSDVTPGAVVTNLETGRKGAISSPHVVPDFSILSAELTLGLPPATTAAAGMDALTHCVESYVGKARNPFARMYAREGFRYLINSFSQVLSHPEDLSARRSMLVGSTMAGFAIFNTDTGASHAISYPLGTYHKVPHGVANALLIPGIIENSIEKGCFDYADLYDLLKDQPKGLISPEEKSKALLMYIRELVTNAELPKDFALYGVTSASVDFLALKSLDLVTAMNNTPVDFTLEDSKRILKDLV